MRRNHLRIVGLLLVVLMLLAVASPAVAGNIDKPRPFHGVYVDPGVPILPTITCVDGIPSAGAGTGYANHLGAYTWHAEFCMVPTSPSTVIVEDGSVTVVAANGDLLYGIFDAEGEFLPDGTMVNTQDLTYEGGTGRFERAVGSATAFGVIAPDGSSYNTFDGVLAFDASDRSH
jgi:hypothetical protein